MLTILIVIVMVPFTGLIVGIFGTGTHKQFDNMFYLTIYGTVTAVVFTWIKKINSFQNLAFYHCGRSSRSHKNCLFLTASTSWLKQ